MNTDIYHNQCSKEHWLAILEREQELYSLNMIMENKDIYIKWLNELKEQVNWLYNSKGTPIFNDEVVYLLSTYMQEHSMLNKFIKRVEAILIYRKKILPDAYSTLPICPSPSDVSPVFTEGTAGKEHW